MVLGIAYVGPDTTLDHDPSRWTDSGTPGIAAFLLGVILAFSLVRFGAAYGVSLWLGEFVALGAFRMSSRIPGVRCHAVVPPPNRADTPREVSRSFGLLLPIAIGSERTFLLARVPHRVLRRDTAIDRLYPFFVDEPAGRSSSRPRTGRRARCTAPLDRRCRVSLRERKSTSTRSIL